MLKTIKFYQRWISPALPASCRFIPSCSSYAAEAIQKFGTIKGGILAGRRLIRCHPLCKSGVDPVPEGPMVNTALVQNTDIQQEGC